MTWLLDSKNNCIGEQFKEDDPPPVLIDVRVRRRVSGSIITHQYDDAGNRVVQDGSGAAKIYPNSYYSVDGTNVDRNILVGSLGSVATSTWNGTVATVIYHHTDHLGGTHVETDGNGNAVEYIIYSPFGGTLIDVKTGAYENEHKYTGKEKDVDTGWYYYGARYYDAGRGAFLSQDPMFAELGTDEKVMTVMLRDPQSQNSYAYARNNPSTLVDPNGECFWDLCIMEGTIAASVITWTAAAGLAVAVPLLMGAVDSYAHSNNAAGDQYMNATMSVYGAVGTVAGIAATNSPNSSKSSVSTSSQNSNWKNPATLNRHYADHGADFGAKNSAEYAKGASSFYTNRNNYQVKIDASGNTRVYDPGTNTFGSYDSNGSTRTYFKPDSASYFDRQPGTLINNKQE